MKTYNTQAEIDADIIDGVLKVDDDIKITFNCIINAHISAWDINALDISAWDINAWDINAGDISAWDIKAWNISALNIEAGDISFYAVCFAYEKFSCKSISGRRENSKFFCLDSEVIIGE